MGSLGVEEERWGGGRGVESRRGGEVGRSLGGEEGSWGGSEEGMRSWRGCWHGSCPSAGSQNLDVGETRLREEVVRARRVFSLRRPTERTLNL